MRLDQQEFSHTYRNLPDEEIAALNAQVESLTEPARMALDAEIDRRGFSRAHLDKLRSSELHGEAKFDRREKWRRKSTLSYLLFRNDPKGTILTFIVCLLAILIWEFVKRHH